MGKNGIGTLEYGDRTYMMEYRHSSVLNADPAAFFPTERIPEPIESPRQLLWALSALAVIIIVSYSYWLYRVIHKPLQHLVKSFRKVGQGQLASVEVAGADGEFEYLLTL